MTGKMIDDKVKGGGEFGVVERKEATAVEKTLTALLISNCAEDLIQDDAEDATVHHVRSAGEAVTNIEQGIDFHKGLFPGLADVCLALGFRRHAEEGHTRFGRVRRVERGAD